jgi:hypothetical protein
MPIQFDNFDQNKIDRLKNHLNVMAEKNKAKFFEIFVDNLKAVPKTDEISDFEAYEDYINVDTEQVKIVIYNTALSPRNDQYVFLLKAKNREDALNLGLNGIGTPIQKFSKTSISEWRENKAIKSEQEIEIQFLKKENSRLARLIEEKDECILQLEQLVEKTKKGNNFLSGYHIGDILGVAVEGLVSRNKGKLANIPILAGLAGLNKRETEPSTEKKEADAEVNFQKMEESTNATTSLSEEDAHDLELIKEIQSKFSEDEFGTILEILDEFAVDKELIEVTLSSLKNQEEEK